VYLRLRLQVRLYNELRKNEMDRPIGILIRRQP
jgi:hypothetical protein